MYVKNGTNFRYTAVGFFVSRVAQYLNVFANIITHPLRVTIASYFCQRLQQLLSLNVFHHYASRCSRRDMQPEPTHARRKPMQPIPVTKVSCQENNIQELTYDEHWSSARRNSGSWMLLAIFIFFVRSFVRRNIWEPGYLGDCTIV